MARHHVPKVDTGDDYDFMCGTCAFGATVGARDLCQSCVKKTLEVVDLLARAYDELASCTTHPRRTKLMRQIDKVLGNRVTVAYADAPLPTPTEKL
jgi:hypothetical protein